MNEQNNSSMNEIPPVHAVSRDETTSETLRNQVAQLFEGWCLEDILATLAQRIRDEAAIARGDGLSRSARRWERIAEDIDSLDIS